MATGKSINIICSIGSVNISKKSIKSIEVDRNFSDVSNKFTLTLIDSPTTGLTDLELYMCAGNRTISLSYSDRPIESDLKMATFKGQIWDYTSNFVGNIKQLTITGYVSKMAEGRDTSGTALYNIDWNNYYCMRMSTQTVWNVSKMLYDHNKRHYEWAERNRNSYNDDLSKYTLENADVVYYDNFSARYKDNAITVKITGPGGSIRLPIPDSFAPMVFATEKNAYAGDDKDPYNKLWGELEARYVDPKTGKEYKGEPSDKENYDVYFIQKNEEYSSGEPCPGKGSIRGFSLVGGETYIQLNPAKDYYGSGVFLNSSLGVDPSYVVKQLCDLEGWKYTDTSIVQTAMVPNSDAFKMNGQSAIAYITEVLAPMSITPAGDYTDSKGNKVTVTSGQAGFTFYFDDKNVAHYEPLSKLYKQDLTSILFGYNIPNSPVISFQVDTKGTCFYTTNAQQINSIFLTTGKQVTSIDTTQNDLINEYNKVKGHNENIDRFFGYTYEQIQAKYKKSNEVDSHSVYLGFGDRTMDFSKNDGWIAGQDNLATQDYVTSSYGYYYNTDHEITDFSNTENGYSSVVSSAVQKNLVTKLSSSAVADPTIVTTSLKNASAKIEEFMITATMNIWGDIRLSPASLISITNMVKSTNSNDVSRHPTSGKYLILKQIDKISTDTFTQQLSLIRANASLSSNINPQKIDYSKKVQSNKTKTELEEKAEKAAQFKKEQIEKAQQGTVLQPILSLWDEYLQAIRSKHPTWVWWKGNPPKIHCDILYMNWPIYHMRTSSGSVIDKADAESSWYTYANLTNSVIGPNIKDPDPNKITVDPIIQAWYERAKEYKSKGKLGTKVLHMPQTNLSCPNDIEYDAKYNLGSSSNTSSKTTLPTNTYQPLPTLPKTSVNTFQSNQNLLLTDPAKIKK